MSRVGRTWWFPIVLTACAESTLRTDAGAADARRVDARARDAAIGEDSAASMPDDAPAVACVGADGWPCLSVGGASSAAPAELSCPAAEPFPGPTVVRSLRLSSVGLSTNEMPFAAIEIWPGNAVTGSCVAPACAALTTDAGARATIALDASYYAYRVPRNDGAMTYAALGYDFAPAATGETEISTMPIGIVRTAVTLIRSGLVADTADGIVVAAAVDCAGRPMRGATARLFGADGVELASGTGALDFGLAYRTSGTLPDRRLATTDFSGSIMAANVPVRPDPRVAVVVEGTDTWSSARHAVGCAEVSVEADAVTIVSIGPYRADYPAGSLCLAHAP